MQLISVASCTSKESSKKGTTMEAKSIYPLKLNGKIVRNPREHVAVSNGWDRSDAYTVGLNINKPKPKR